MDDPTLFDEPAPNTRARTTDPETSKKAAKTIKAGSQYERLIAAADYHEAYTAHELGHRSRLNEGVASYWKRISELVAMGYLRIGETRICSISKHEVQTYRLTGLGLQTWSKLVKS